MCGIGQVLQMGFGMMSSAAQSKARIEEQNRQYEANKAAAEASYAAGVETSSLKFLQNNKKVRQQGFDFELMGKLQESNLKAMAGSSNLTGTSIRSTVYDARGKWTKDARRFIDERKNLADGYEMDLHNLQVTKENQINTVMQGRWTAGDTMSMLAPVVNGFSSLMIQGQNQGYQQQRMGSIGQSPYGQSYGGYGGGYGGGSGMGFMGQTYNPMGGYR
jgi:hypothetical protein